MPPVDAHDTSSFLNFLASTLVFHSLLTVISSDYKERSLGLTSNASNLCFSAVMDFLDINHSEPDFQVTNWAYYSIIFVWTVNIIVY